MKECFTLFGESERHPIRHNMDELPIGTGIARFNKILESDAPNKDGLWNSFLSGDFYIFHGTLATRKQRLQKIFAKWPPGTITNEANFLLVRKQITIEPRHNSKPLSYKKKKI